MLQTVDKRGAGAWLQHYLQPFKYKVGYLEQKVRKNSSRLLSPQ